MSLVPQDILVCLFFLGFEYADELCLSVPEFRMKRNGSSHGKSDEQLANVPQNQPSHTTGSYTGEFNTQTI